MFRDDKDSSEIWRLLNLADKLHAFTLKLRMTIYDLSSCLVNYSIRNIVKKHSVNFTFVISVTIQAIVDKFDQIFIFWSPIGLTIQTQR